jgi:apolipoprotein D and lipocalin family protein
MWILSREPTIPDDVKSEYVSIAQSIGVRTDDLIWVEHTEGN